jgi:hypothetical protein
MAISEATGGSAGYIGGNDFGSAKPNKSTGISSNASTMSADDDQEDPDIQAAVVVARQHLPLLASI